MKAIKLWDIERLYISEWRRGKQALRLRLMDLDDGASLSMLCGIIASKKSGPLVTVVAGQHGDEWNGTYICHQLYNKLEPQDIKKGTLVIVPVANPWAFLERGRVSSIDVVDMNRSYSLTKSEKPTEYIAELLFKKIYSQSDYLLDIHTGGPGKYLPNIGITDQGRVELATRLNTGYVVVAHKEYGSLIYACERSSVPALSVEIGRRLTIDYKSCDNFLDRGLLNLLKSLEMYPGNENTVPGQKLFTVKTVVTSPISGFFRPHAVLGQVVDEGELLGEVTPIFSTRPEKIIAPAPGSVLYLRREEKVSVSDTLIHLAHEHS